MQKKLSQWKKLSLHLGSSHTVGFISSNARSQFFLLSKLLFTEDPPRRHPQKLTSELCQSMPLAAKEAIH